MSNPVQVTLQSIKVRKHNETHKLYVRLLFADTRHTVHTRTYQGSLFKRILPHLMSGDATAQWTAQRHLGMDLGTGRFRSHVLLRLDDDTIADLGTPLAGAAQDIILTLRKDENFLTLRQALEAAWEVEIPNAIKR